MVAITVVLVASVRSCHINPAQALDVFLGLSIGFCLEKLWGISWQLDALTIQHCGYYESLAAAPACGHEKAAIFKLSWLFRGFVSSRDCASRSWKTS